MKPRQRTFIVYLLLLAAFHLIGCTRPGNSKPSLVYFKLPNHPDINAKATNQMMAITTPQVCYMINVIGPDIPSVTETCLPALGITTPLASPGSEVSLSINKGKGRVFEVYAYLTQVGESCEAINSIKSASPNRLYLMGKTDPIELSKDQEAITLVAKFPGINNSLANIQSLPSQCITDRQPASNADQPTDFNGGLFRGKTYVLQGSIASEAPSTKLKSSKNYLLRGGISHVIK